MDGWLERFDARLNPMLVKDLRLSMRVRGVLLVYFVSLFMSVAGSILYTFAARASRGDGAGLLPWVYGVCSLLCGAVIPYMVYNRFRQELANRATELVLMTAISPRQLVRGKLLSAWCSSLLVLSAAAPAILAVYLLGGVDANITLLMAVCLGWTALAMPCAQLMLSTFDSGNFTQLAAIIVMLMQLGWMGFTNAALYGIMQDSRFGQAARPSLELWGLVGLLGATGALLAYFCYNVAVGRLTSRAGNCAAAPRLSLMATLWFFVPAAVGLVVALRPAAGAAGPRWLRPGVMEATFGAVAVALYLLLPALLPLCLSAETVSRRLRRHWPKSLLAGMLFYPGERRLAVFGLLNFGLLLLVLLGAHHLTAGAAGGHMRMDTLLRLWLPPFLAFAIGMVAHLGVVAPALRRWGRSLPAAASLAGVNILLALATTAGAILVTMQVFPRTLLPLWLAASPFGVLIAPTYSGRDLQDAVFHASLIEALAAALLLGLLAALPALEETLRFRRRRGQDA